jgi:hypothetical protein
MEALGGVGALLEGLSGRSKNVTCRLELARGAALRNGSQDAALKICFRSSKAICGGGRESNPPTDSRRRTGFEDLKIRDIRVNLESIEPPEGRCRFV